MNNYIENGITENEDNGSISLHINRGSVRWIEMDGKHPIKLSTE